MFIFLDESGDLGFNSSKKSDYFTIALLVCLDKNTQEKIKKAVKRTLKNKLNPRNTKKVVQELKGTATSLEIKKYFLEKMPLSGWTVYAITVNKLNFREKLKTSEGKKKLYNCMANQIIKKIPDPISDSITLVVDKCKNKYEREDFDQYIKIGLNNKFGANIRIFIQHDSSQNNHCLQAVDLFCWGIRRKNALADNEWSNCYEDKVVEDSQYYEA